MLFLLRRVDGPIAPWDPKRGAEETEQTGGHPLVASQFFLLHVLTGKKELNSMKLGEGAKTHS